MLHPHPRPPMVPYTVKVGKEENAKTANPSCPRCTVTCTHVCTNIVLGGVEEARLIFMERTRSRLPLQTLPGSLSSANNRPAECATSGICTNHAHPIPIPTKTQHSQTSHSDPPSWLRTGLWYCTIVCSPMKIAQVNERTSNTQVG